VRRAAFCFVLSTFFLPWAIYADPPGSTSTVRSLPADEQSSASQPKATPAPRRGDSGSGLTTAHGRFPHTFVENRGQVDERAKLFLRSGHQTLWLTNEGVVFDLLLTGEEARAPTATLAERRIRRPNLPQERLVFSQDFVGANQGATIEPTQLLPGIYNYYFGSDPTRWRAGVRAYAEVVYREVWARIDLRLYGNGRYLEQEFVVKPGGDSSKIRVAYWGIEGLRVAEDGALVIRTAFGKLRESPPAIYQEIDGKRTAATGRFKLLGPTAYTFEVGRYQPRYALVIDPTLVYATYLGGTQEDGAGGIAVDAVGHAYVAGSTLSSSFPTVVGLPART